MIATACFSLVLLAAPASRPATRLDKFARMVALEDARSMGGGELERLLRDADKGVRRRAALAAGRIADPSAIPPLVDMMNDSEAELRQMAAFGLGLIGDPQAAPRLVAALKDPKLRKLYDRLGHDEFLATTR